jgi:hypothetical protein
VNVQGDPFEVSDAGGREEARIEVKGPFWGGRVAGLAGGEDVVDADP